MGSRASSLKLLGCRMLACLPKISACADLNSTDHDCLVLVSPDLKDVGHEGVFKALDSVAEIDKKALTSVTLVPVGLPCKRLVYSPTGPLDKDYDDVRRFADASNAGVKRALAAGAKSPLLMVLGALPGVQTKDIQVSALLGALAATYVPLEIRDLGGDGVRKVSCLGWMGDSKVADEASALETGRIVCRDIGGSDPERTAAPRVEEYVMNYFSGSSVKVEVVKGQETFVKEYPCLAAVNRCASHVDRHDGRVIWLTYEPEGKVEKTLYMVGKGITYDTGSADIKAGGIMAGMSRDKCGAASAAGVMATVNLLKPAGVKVVAAMAMVRNSVGSDAYVADEIITSRAGVRLRVGNTDAEGRMAMVDVLCKCKEMAIGKPDPQLFTIATLTGHACIAVGDYSAVMDNGPARQAGVAVSLQKAGSKVGDMLEVSTIRREDWEFNMDKSGEFVSILQCNNLPSTRTKRGHQIPGAFLQQVSGLDKHQLSSEHPLKYSHIDIAGAAGDLPGYPTGNSIPALIKMFIK